VESKIRLSVLSRRSDFLFILKHGQRVRPSDWLLMNFVRNEVKTLRCGWTLPRQIGPAVVRNRLRRWSRVYFRDRLKAGAQLPIDLNLVFRRAEENFYKKLDYESFARVLDRGWKQVEGRLERIPEISASVSHGGLQSDRSRSPRRGLPV
jgi:ribonuclease P protein component